MFQEDMALGDGGLEMAQSHSFVSELLIVMTLLAIVDERIASSRRESHR